MMMSLIVVSQIGLVFLASYGGFVSATLSGSGDISTHIYEGMAGLDTNPPFCGMPYAELQLNRITAVQGLQKDQCGKCIKVTSGKDTSKSVYLLAVDQGGAGLDINSQAWDTLFNEPPSKAPATWEEADSSQCAGVWSQGGSGVAQYSTAAAPPAQSATATGKDTPSPLPASVNATTNAPSVPTIPAPHIPVGGNEGIPGNSATSPVYSTLPAPDGSTAPTPVAGEGYTPASAEGHPAHHEQPAIPTPSNPSTDPAQSSVPTFPGNNPNIPDAQGTAPGYPGVSANTASPTTDPAQTIAPVVPGNNPAIPDAQGVASGYPGVSANPASPTADPAQSALPSPTTPTA
ncbi:hypothetical protein IWQ62_005813 [Dispira parvispora]|uniref:Uncharacterized protein n=1 Tax=Dispira parvispora TaxID=1520584 RepID=A0A9W8AM24_9FUNG|nr:hypothetical protein IWQ62_005813 [Dispira parvispora]